MAVAQHVRQCLLLLLSQFEAAGAEVGAQFPPCAQVGVVW